MQWWPDRCMFPFGCSLFPFGCSPLAASPVDNWHSGHKYGRGQFASTKQQLPVIESGSCHIPTDNTGGGPQARPQVVKTAASETSAFFRESLFCRGELATLTVLMTAVPVRQ